MMNLEMCGCSTMEIIRNLGFLYLDDYSSTLADGGEIEMSGWEGRVIWHGRRRSVLVLEAEGDPLLGMNLLWRNWITIDNYANGPVLIEELV